MIDFISSDMVECFAYGFLAGALSSGLVFAIRAVVVVALRTIRGRDS